MLISCFCRHKLVSSEQFKKSFFQITSRHTLRNGEALYFRKSFHSTILRCSKEKTIKLLKDRTGNSRNFRRLLSFAEPEKYTLAAAVGLLVISSSITMSIPFALGKVIDIIYSMDQIKTGHMESVVVPDSERDVIMLNLKKVCVVLIGMFTIGAMANFGRVYLMRMVSARMAARIRNLVYSSIVRQEVAFFDKNKTGELINRLSADSVLVSHAIGQQISDGLRSTFMTGAGIGMMFFMSPQLALVSLAVVPPVAAWGVLMGRKVRKTSRKVQDALAEATQVAEEKISNIRTVRMFAKEEMEVSKYNNEMQKVVAISKKEAILQAQFFGWTGLSGNMIILTVLYYGGSLVTTDVISVGNLTSFILYAAYVGIGFSGLSSSYAETMKAMGASERLWEITDRKPLMPLNNKEQLVPTMPLRGNIKFEKVNFNYPSREDVQILSNLDLTVPSDHVMAIVGGSGSGKSTLAALLLRLYDTDSGKITIDGYDIRELDPTWLRRQIGTVAQEPVLFSSSIRDNITYGETADTTQEEVEAAAKEANAHDFITSFPDGYGTLVGERGIMLSGGQKQRIAIARAILKNPQILLLDEATSALDTASEHQVKLALDRVMKGRCVIMIAHRLSTIQNANQIAVLNGGKIVEQGTYSELISLANGHFRTLVRK